MIRVLTHLGLSHRVLREKRTRSFEKEREKEGERGSLSRELAVEYGPYLISDLDNLFRKGDTPKLC